MVNQVKARLDAEAERLAAISRNLTRARDLLANGYITEGADGNAVDLLREVERLDPGNARAKALLADSAERLAAVAREAHVAGLTDEALHYLDLARAVTPDVAEWQQLRATWEKNATTD